MKNILPFIFLLLRVSFISCEEVLFRVTKDIPAWTGSTFRENNIATTIKKGEIVKGNRFYLGMYDITYYLSKIEYNNHKYTVRMDTLVPAYTVDLFDVTWITDDRWINSHWYLDYYLTVLRSENRDTFYEFEYEEIDNWHIEMDTIVDKLHDYWYQYFNVYAPCLVIQQTGISAGGFVKKGFLITNIAKINNWYKVTVIDCKFVDDDYLKGTAYYNLDYENTIAFPTDKLYFDLLFIRDNDYMDMYLDTPETHLAAFAMVNKVIRDELDSLRERNTCDLSKITYWPRRSPKQFSLGEECRILENLKLRESPETAGAVITTMEHGSKVTILEIGQDAVIDGVSSPWVKVQTASGLVGWCYGLYLRGMRFEPTPEELAVTVKSKAEETENSVVKEESAKANTLPIWALAVIAGGVIAVAVGVVLIIKKSRK
jgi:hypothetical protein